MVVVDPGIVTVRGRSASPQPSSGLRVLIADENRTFGGSGRAGRLTPDGLLAGVLGAVAFTAATVWSAFFP